MGYQTISITNGFNLISLNFEPMSGESVDIQDLVADKENLVAGNASTTSDQIQIWDGSKFEVYFYRAYKANNPGRFTIGPCWVNANAASAKASLSIPAGAGFWYARPSDKTAGTLTQTSPLAE